jgi:hypothetical protein
VADVVAEQVNMTVVDRRAALAKMRDILAKASVSSARKWTFKPPPRRGQHPGQLDGTRAGELRPEQ